MIPLGIACGLLTGLFQSIAYILSRWFGVTRGASTMTLLVCSHTVMALASAVMLPFLIPAHMPPPGQYLWLVAGAAGTYITGQGLLFTALATTDASRIAPLLGLKIVVVAALAMLLLGDHLGVVQWIAVAMSVGGAMLLSTWAGKMPARALTLTIIACVFFAVCDALIKLLLQQLKADCGDLRGSTIAALMTYMGAGLCCAVTLPWLGSRRQADWRIAVPHAAVWLTGILLLFVSFSLAGIVLGNLAMAMRGIISIGLGALLARAGHHHIEAHTPRKILIRRLFAALLMIAAMTLYVMYSPPHH